MSKRTEGNIGESQKTSVKVHHQPGGQSNWSLGWGEEEKKPSTYLNNLSSKVSQPKQHCAGRQKLRRRRGVKKKTRIGEKEKGRRIEQKTPLI
jgi:hypothetical protein